VSTHNKIIPGTRHAQRAKITLTILSVLEFLIPKTGSFLKILYPTYIGIKSNQIPNIIVKTPIILFIFIFILISLSKLYV
jgi:hypothetical protein